jgi:glutamyl-tRNA reductase
LQSIAEQSLTLRRQQIAAGEEIIADHVADFCGWLLRDTAKRMQRTSDGMTETLRVSES